MHLIGFYLIFPVQHRITYFFYAILLSKLLIVILYTIIIIINRMDFHHHLTVINDSISSEMEFSKKVRFISAEKWRGLMLNVLLKLRKKEFYDINLIEDYITVVQKIPEEKLVETIMHIEPFKPNFMRKSRRSFSKENENYIRTSNEKSNLFEQKRLQLSSIIKFKHQIHSIVRDSIFQIQQQNPKNSLLQETLALITQEETLSKEFQAQYHPFREVIQQTLFLLEHKYKNYITNNETNLSIEKIQEMLLYDLNLLQEFIIKASVPYLKIFKSRNKEEKMEFQIELIAFIKKYLDRHASINALIKKILKYALKRSQNLRNLQAMIPNFVQIGFFNVDGKYRIDGQYSFAINTLIQLSQSTNPKKSLIKLQQLRSNILRDIDEYYMKAKISESTDVFSYQQQFKLNHAAGLKISVETQLQILKFLLCKGKIFLIDIMAQLKYLQTVLGQDDISFKFDDSSFMYAQLMVAIQILSLEFR